MKESPRMKVFANYDGKSIPIIPKIQVDYLKIVSFKIYISGSIEYNFPPIVISKVGNEETVLQSI